MKTCRRCKSPTHPNYGYEWDAENKQRVYFCRKCTRIRKTASKRDAWAFLTRHFQSNTTYGGTHDRQVVAAARVVSSGWAGDTFIMLSAGRKLVRYWHRDSPGNPGK